MRQQIGSGPVGFRHELELVAAGVLAGLGLSRVVNGPVRSPALATQTQDAGARADSGRGRQADSPAQIPARGWWQIARRVAGKFSSNRVLAEAAGVTFYALLALFPALAALVSLYGLFANPAAIETQLQGAGGVVPGGGMQIITQQVHSLASNGRSALGLGLAIGLVTSLWSANAAIKALFDALNAVYEERETRGFVRLTAISMAFTLGAILFIILALVGVVVLPVALNAVGLGGVTALLLRVLRWPVLVVVVAVFLALVYRYGPSRAKARWRWVSWGSAFASLAWLVVSLAFSWYVASFGSYNKTYGSLGAAVGFMTWIWLSVAVVLIGAEVNAEMEHQTARDTTQGAGEKPLGMRGAKKADTLAA